jgi:prepilin-type N-terminal cleavage/methylation domain-containing protein
MNPRFSNQTNCALTLTEVLVVIVVLAVLVMILIPTGPVGKDRAMRIACANNLKQIVLAYKIWPDDQSDKYPMQIPIKYGGTMEFTDTSECFRHFQIISNELTTPKILICPADTDRFAATNFTAGIGNKILSYFVGLDAADEYPNRWLSGDDNFEIEGDSVKPGLLRLLTNTPVAWNSSRHVLPNVHLWTPARDKFIGNIGLADGSVQEVNIVGLQMALQNTGLATNRLAIP